MRYWTLFRLISLNHLKYQKLQTAMASGGVCLGVMAIVSIGLVNQSITSSFEKSFIAATGRATLQISASESGFPETLVETVSTVSGVRHAVPVIEADGLLTEGKAPAVMVLGIDILTDSQVRDYTLSDETDDASDPLVFLANPDSILITKTMAEREHIRLDQEINIQTVEGIRRFRVRGILDPTGPAKALGGNVIVMDLYAAQIAFGKPGRIDRIDISVKNDQELETVRERLIYALPEGYLVETPSGRSFQVQVMISNFQQGFNVISFLTLFAGMYLIYNAVSISVVQRRKVIGVLRAIGAFRREILILFVGEILMLSIIASSLGIGLGFLLAKGMDETFSKVISETYVRTVASTIHWSWGYPLAGLISGVISSLVAAYIPLRATGRISPVPTIRAVPNDKHHLMTFKRLNISAAACLFLSLITFALYISRENSPIAKNIPLLIGVQMLLILGISLFCPLFLKGFVLTFQRVIAVFGGVMGPLAATNLQKNIPRNAVAVAAVFYGISIFVSASGLVHSVKASVVNWIETVNRADIIVTSGHPMSSTNAPVVPMPIGLAAEIESTPGVLSADPWRKVSITYHGRRVLLSSVDIRRRAEYSTLPSADDDTRENLLRLLPNEDRVAVSEAFAALFGVGASDTLILPTPKGPTRFDVAAVVVDYTTDIGTIVIDSHTFQRHWEDQLVNSFSIRIQPGTDVLEIAAAIQQRLGRNRKLFVLPAKEYKNEVRKALDGMFIYNYALNVITLTIAGLGIIITLFSSVLERTREIGILRAVGMLARQISAVVMLESVLMGLAGGILGAIGGIISGWISLEGLFVASYGSAAKYFIPYAAVLSAMFLSAGLSAVAGIIPAREAAKTNIVEALGYE